MAAPYIPAQNAALDAWAANFSTLITASPSTYGLAPADAVAIASAVSAFHAAYLLAGMTAPPHPVPVSPSTRTPITVGSMNAAAGAMKTLIRTYAAQLRLNPGVSSPNKLALGLNLPNTTPTPVPVPVSYPLLSFLLAAPLTHQFSYKDSMTPVGKRKAVGAVQLQLVGAASATPLVDPTLFPPLPAQTKSPFQVMWPSGAGGKTAYYAARWITRTGLVGPWSPISNALILAV